MVLGELKGFEDSEGGGGGGEGGEEVAIGGDFGGHFFDGGIDGRGVWWGHGFGIGLEVKEVVGS